MSHTYVEADRKRAEESAARDFRDHVLTKEGEGRWYFGQPGSGFFHMRVITAPGWVITVGDGEDLMFHPSDRNALGWLLGVLDCGPAGTVSNVHHGGVSHGWDLGYICSKIPQNVEVAKFDQALVERYIAELRHEATELFDSAENLAALAEELADHGDFENAHEFYDALHNNDAGVEIDEGPRVEGLTYGVMHTIAGLYYFCQALEAYEVTQEAARMR